MRQSTQDLGQEEMHSPLQWPISLSGTSETLPTVESKCTSLYFPLTVPRSALWSQAEQI